MKYIIRAVKYFLYISIIVIVLLSILVILGFVSSDVNIMFRNGWKSVGLIAIMFACVSAFYPKFGYCSRLATIPGDPAESRSGIISYMESRKYVLTSEKDGKMKFNRKSALQRAVKVWEDTITMEPSLGGYYVEGLSRDVAPIVYGLNFKFANPENE